MTGKAHEILSYPVITEDAISQIEAENKLVYIVDRKATEREITRIFEERYEVKVEKINSLITPKGEKKAYIKLKPEFKAVDLAIRIGLL